MDFIIWPLKGLIIIKIILKSIFLILEKRMQFKQIGAYPQVTLNVVRLELYDVPVGEYFAGFQLLNDGLRIDLQYSLLEDQLFLGDFIFNDCDLATAVKLRDESSNQSIISVYIDSLRLWIRWPHYYNYKVINQSVVLNLSEAIHQFIYLVEWLQDVFETFCTCYHDLSWNEYQEGHLWAF